MHGSFGSRLGYSLTRTLVAKTDHGNTTFNFAEVVGNGIGAEISSAYYPTERSLSDVLTRWGTQIATDSLSNVLKDSGLISSATCTRSRQKAYCKVNNVRFFAASRAAPMPLR